MAARLKAVLPAAWFADATPVLDGLLAGLAGAWAWLYALLAHVRRQTRIATATGVWLDVISGDFFGTRLPRRPGQADAAFRSRILLELKRERATRHAVSAALQDLTGRAPVIFEPARSTDTGCYALGTLGWGTAGGWGSLALPCQCFITAFRPLGAGIAGAGGYSTGPGGWNTGSMQYAALAMMQGEVTDADIMAAIAAAMPTAAIGWTRITN